MLVRSEIEHVPMGNGSGFPDGIFTTRDAAGRDINRRELGEAVSAGMLRRYIRGVYGPGAWPDDLEHRARAAATILSSGSVFVDRTAAWLHGVDVLGFAETEILPGVETAVLTRQRASRALGVRGRSRDLAPYDVMEIRGIRLTTPTRTALDLACNVRRAEAVGALDAFARLHGVTKEVLLAMLIRFKGRRGVVQARQLVNLMDPRAESARESQLRLAILDAGLPCPTPQHVVVIDGCEFRLDLAYPAHRVAVEYDGQEFHSGTEQLAHDVRRRQLLREAGWSVIVVERGDFSGDRLPTWLADVRMALDGRYTTLRW
jgi:very-short-patch-repair endonuclease